MHFEKLYVQENILFYVKQYGEKWSCLDVKV